MNNELIPYNIIGDGHIVALLNDNLRRIHTLSEYPVSHVTLTPARMHELLTATGMNGDGLQFNGIPIQLGECSALWVDVIEEEDIQELVQALDAVRDVAQKMAEAINNAATAAADAGRRVGRYIEVYIRRN